MISHNYSSQSSCFILFTWRLILLLLLLICLMTSVHLVLWQRRMVSAKANSASLFLPNNFTICFFAGSQHHINFLEMWLSLFHSFIWWMKRKLGAVSKIPPALIDTCVCKNMLGLYYCGSNVNCQLDGNFILNCICFEQLPEMFE